MDMPSVEDIVAGLAGVVTVVVLAWNKMKDLRSPAKKAEADILEHIRGEKDELIRQREISVAREDALRVANQELTDKLKDLHQEVEEMNRRLILLTELNKRLAAGLDATKAQLEEYLQVHPQPRVQDVLAPRRLPLP